MGRTRRRRDQRGQSLVSFALAMVPFFLLLLSLHALRGRLRPALERPFPAGGGGRLPDLGLSGRDL